MIKKLIRAIKDPRLFILGPAGRGWFNWMDDETYLRMMYRLQMGKKLDLDNPKTFNEKLQWLKIHDRKDIYTTMVDKYAAKKYVADIIGEEYIIPTLGVWNSFDEIDFDKLPDQFVLKCTHDSGGLVIVKDKAKLDKATAKKKLEQCLKRNYYWSGREWPYKKVKPRILAEKYMEDNATKELRDYKIFTFDGVAKALFVATDRQKEGEDVKFDFYDVDFKHLPFKQGHENANVQPQKPETFEQMLRLAEKLSEGIPQVRVDFYEVNGATYFGEMTFSHFGGMVPFKPEEWDYKLGELITLPDEIGGGYAIKCKDFVLWVHEELKRPEGLTDYKFYCFNGEAKFLYVAKANFINGEKNDLLEFYTLDWRKAPFQRHDHSPLPYTVDRPKNFDQMFRFSEVLAQGVPFVRVDWYEINGQMFFGEATFSPGGGYGEFYPAEWNNIFGSWIDLEKIKEG